MEGDCSAGLLLCMCLLLTFRGSRIQTPPLHFLKQPTTVTGFLLSVSSSPLLALAHAWPSSSHPSPYRDCPSSTTIPPCHCGHHGPILRDQHYFYIQTESGYYRSGEVGAGAVCWCACRSFSGGLRASAGSLVPFGPSDIQFMAKMRYESGTRRSTFKGRVGAVQRSSS